jgi:hypothetical protein
VVGAEALLLLMTKVVVAIFMLLQHLMGLIQQSLDQLLYFFALRAVEREVPAITPKVLSARLVLLEVLVEVCLATLTITACVLEELQLKLLKVLPQE